MEEAVNETVDILCRARALYASAPSHAPAEYAPEPDTYCVIYALHFAARGASNDDSPAFQAFARVIDDRSVSTWNAEHTTVEVLAAFDRAIAAQRLVVPPLERPGRPVPVAA
jgi:hypothetical protein